MLNIRLRTEYSFRKAFGHTKKVVESAAGEAVGICDTGTWGHVAFDKACKQLNKKPLFGTEISFVEDSTKREKQPANQMAFIAKSNKGLKELYELVTKSTEKENFYYFPRLSYSDLFDVSDELIVLSGTHPAWGMLPLARKNNLYIEINPMSCRKALDFCEAKGFKSISTSDNYFPKVDDRKGYEVLVGQNRINRTAPMHILNEWELKDLVPWIPDSAF